MSRAFSESFALVLAVSAALILIGEPFWQTNDDPAMAAALHGFGDSIAQSTPWLINSNIAWGYLLRLVPDMGGVLGYTTGNYLVILASMVAIHVSMVKQGVDPVCRVVLTCLFLSWLILFPQFTITAGLSTVAAIALLKLYWLTKRPGILIVSTAFAIVGFLIRDLQFAFVALVALPWLVNPGIREPRVLITGAITILMLLAAWQLNHQSYQEAEWQHYLTLNEARASYTDYDGASRVLESEAARQAGYSTNDIMLLRNWFFADQKLADPKSMLDMLANSPERSSDWQVSDALTPFINFRHLWALLLTALLLSLLSRSGKVAIAWLIFLAAAFSISYTGRIVPERLIIPIYLLLCYGSLLRIQESQVKKVAAVTVTLAFVGNGFLLADAQSRWQADIKLQEQIAGYLAKPRSVVWGDAYRSEIVHRPFQRDVRFRQHSYQAIGQSAWAPYTRAYQANQQGEGILDLLVSAEGIQLIAFAYQVKMLGEYCAEHQNRQMETSGSLANSADDALVVTNVRCFIFL